MSARVPVVLWWCVVSAVVGGVVTYALVSPKKKGRSQLAAAPAPAAAAAGGEAPKSIAERLARPNILALTPYRCARDDYDAGILLDANENSFGPTQPPSAANNPNPNPNAIKTSVSSNRSRT